jgi:hypothetical protein
LIFISLFLYLGGLSTGAIVGIVIGVLAGIALIGGVSFFLLKKKKSKKSKKVARAGVTPAARSSAPGMVETGQDNPGSEIELS